MTGRMIEDLVVLKMKERCSIMKDATFDHVYKLDFIVNQVKLIHKLIPIGVQITSHLNNIPKMREFYVCRQKKTLVDRSLYIEIDPDVDIEAFGAELIYTAIIAFMFQEEMRQYSVYGVRIKPDVTFSFFDLEQVAGFNDAQTDACQFVSESEEDEELVANSPTARVVQLPVKPQSPVPVTPPAKLIVPKNNRSNIRITTKEPATEDESLMQDALAATPTYGYLTHFNAEKGYGFILDDQGKQYFFHATKILEDDVSNEIIRRMKEQFYGKDLKRPIRVSFIDVGYQGKEKKYPSAVDIRMSKE